MDIEGLATKIDCLYLFFRVAINAYIHLLLLAFAFVCFWFAKYKISADVRVIMQAQCLVIYLF